MGGRRRARARGVEWMWVCWGGRTERVEGGVRVSARGGRSVGGGKKGRYERAEGLVEERRRVVLAVCAGVFVFESEVRPAACAECCARAIC